MRTSRSLCRGLAAGCIALVACGGGDDGKGPGRPGNQGDLALTVGPAGVVVARGGMVWLDVELTRESGASGDATITVPAPPDGVGVDLLTFPPTITTGSIGITVSPAAPPGDLPLDVVATAGSAKATARIVIKVAEPPPTVRARITEALEAGTIDLGTALLYRCYARFGDERLPESYRGSGEEDLGLLDEIEAATPQLSAEALAKLLPYTVRPADPASVYATDPGLGTKGLAATAYPPPQDCTGGNTWRSQRSGQIPVRVWIECHEGVAAAEADAMAHVLKIFEKVWPSMSSLMGPPLLDAAGQEQGGDDAIDVYLVQGGIRRNGETHDVTSLARLNAAAYACPTLPIKTNGSGKKISSGFIVAPRLGSMSEKLRGTLIHELFHVFQSAHNRGFQFRASTTAAKEAEEYWFVEASAVWAKVHYDRKLPWPAPIRGSEHDEKYSSFELSSESLNTSVPLGHTYDAYAWPLFLEQTSQSNEIIGNLWRGLERAGSFSEADDILNGIGPFEKNFHVFTMQNQNKAFLPGDPLPRDKRYVKLDDLFPDSVYTPTRKLVNLEGGQLYEQNLNMAPLSAVYLRLRPGNKVGKVELDLSGLQPEGSLDVDALIETKDGWVAKPVPLEGKVVFCFDEGPSTETKRGSFATIELVLSNHAHAPGDKVAGLLRIDPTSKPCGVWVGTNRVTYDSSTLAGPVKMVIDANVTFEFDEDAEQGPGAVTYRLASGNYTYRLDFNEVNHQPACRTFGTAAGAMHRGEPTDVSPGSTYTTMTIFTEEEPPTYFAGGGTWMDITTTSNCNDDHVDEVSNIVSAVQWWQAAAPEATKEKGTVISGTLDIADGMGATMKYEWSYAKMRQ